MFDGTNKLKYGQKSLKCGLYLHQQPSLPEDSEFT